MRWRYGDDPVMIALVIFASLLVAIALISGLVLLTD